MENFVKLSYEYDNYTNKKYYILYIILKNENSEILNIIGIEEEKIDEQNFQIIIYFKDEHTEKIIINKKELNKEFTFIKKRLAKERTNYIIRLANNSKIIFNQSNKNLFQKYFYLDI